MHIPKSVLTVESNFEKQGTRGSDTMLFKDKSVNMAQEPLLFGIEAGLAVTDVVVNGDAGNLRVNTSQKIQSEGARNLLRQLNIAYVNIPKDFSLITDTSGNALIENKNILNTSAFEKIFSIGVTAIDKFPTNTDPFYKLDEGNLSNYYYEVETMAGVVVNVPDLSKVASNMTTLNLSATYHGASKYFTATAKI